MPCRPNPFPSPLGATKPNIGSRPGVEPLLDSKEEPATPPHTFLLDDDSIFSLIAPIWQPVYRTAISQLAASRVHAPPPHPQCFPTFPKRAFWVKWIEKHLLRYLVYPYNFEPRQPHAVWKAWAQCNLPSDLKDFVHSARWQKLLMGHRQANWRPADINCPLNGALGTMQHALLHCRYLPVAFDTIVQLSNASLTGRTVGVQHLIDGDLAQSLWTPVGVLAWTAIRASWLLHGAVKHTLEARNTFSLFLKRSLSFNP